MSHVRLIGSLSVKKISFDVGVRGEVKTLTEHWISVRLEASQTKLVGVTELLPRISKCLLLTFDQTFVFMKGKTAVCSM